MEEQAKAEKANVVAQEKIDKQLKLKQARDTEVVEKDREEKRHKKEHEQKEKREGEEAAKQEREVCVTAPFVSLQLRFALRVQS